MKYPALPVRAIVLLMVALVVIALPLGGTTAAQGPSTPGELVRDQVSARTDADLASMQAFRPGYEFWQNIFSIPDGSIAYGSATTGRLIAVFPTRGDWARQARWTDASMSSTLSGESLPRDLNDRRDLVALLLEKSEGPMVHNPTRGQFLLPNVPRYGRFLREWGLIYERFGVPAELGLAQAIIESGLDGTRRSEARAVGFCQWLEGNWKQLNRLADGVIEGRNQTTQAPYCAAYLTVLATKYGSFIPALSEHHSGGTNVGRTLINGARLGGTEVRSQYFMGSQLARDLRQISLDGYREVYRTYGPRSYYYAEMVFGNMPAVRSLMASTPQVRIFAMKTPRDISLRDLARRTRLSVDELRRFNPALVQEVPANATVYLPSYIKTLGRDVAFWHRPPAAAYSSILNEFLRLEAGPEKWDNPSFRPVLEGFARRFKATRTEEGSVMATVLAYAMNEAFTSTRREILAEFRASRDVERLFHKGVVERERVHQTEATLRAR